MLDNLTDEQCAKFRGSLAFAELKLGQAADQLKIAEQDLELDRLKADHAARLQSAINVLKASQEPARDRLAEQSRRLDAAVSEARTAHQVAREVFIQRRDAAPQ